MPSKKEASKKAAPEEAKGATSTKPTLTEKAEAAKVKKAEAEAVKAKKAEEKAAAAKKRNEERAAAKAKKDKERQEKAKPHKGVVHQIATMLSRKEGASKVEIIDHLTKTFPDRDPEKMGTTLSIQITRLAQTHGVEIKRQKDDSEGGRGLIYKAPASLVGLVEKRSVRIGRAATA